MHLSVQYHLLPYLTPGTLCCHRHALTQLQMAGLPSSVVQRAAVVARQLKARLGAQQQDQQQQQQSKQQFNHEQAAAPQHQQQQDVGQTAALPGLVAQIRQALKMLQQGDSQLSELETSNLQQLQDSAAQVLAAESEHVS